jgi:hypothetical protein
MMTNWLVFTNQIGVLAFGFNSDAAAQFGEFVRTAVDERTYREIIFPGIEALEMSSPLRSVRTRTLTLLHSGLPHIFADAVKSMNARIRDARLIEIEGYALQNQLALRREVTDFMGWPIT